MPLLIQEREFFLVLRSVVDLGNHSSYRELNILIKPLKDLQGFLNVFTVFQDVPNDFTLIFSMHVSLTLRL